MVDKRYVEVLKRASSFLDTKGLEPYLAEYLLLERQGWTKTDLVLNMRQPMPQAIETQFEADLADVISGLPPQYVIGSCDFYGHRFQVTPATLIPRPETEELVQSCLAENDHKERLTVLDIGTGTGAIAVTLQKEAPEWDVTAVDISQEALAVAEANNQRLETDVTFVLSDLTREVQDQCFDIIISNPPYIGEEEWSEMGASVLAHEPKLALFADNHGLAIYERLAKELPKISHEKTKIYLEIGYLQGKAVKSIFEQQMPTREVIVKKDVFGQDRMVLIK